MWVSVTWLIPSNSTALPQEWHDWLIWVTGLMRVVVIAVTHTCVAQLTHTSHGTHAYVWFYWFWVLPLKKFEWQDPSICLMPLKEFEWQDPSICAWRGLTWPDNTCKVERSCERDMPDYLYESGDVYVFVTWFIHMTHICDYCDSYECESHSDHVFHSYESQQSHICCDSYEWKYMC